MTEYHFLFSSPLFLSLFSDGSSDGLNTARSEANSFLGPSSHASSHPFHPSPAIKFKWHNEFMNEFNEEISKDRPLKRTDAGKDAKADAHTDHVDSKQLKFFANLLRSVDKKTKHGVKGKEIETNDKHDNDNDNHYDDDDDSVPTSRDGWPGARPW